MSGHWIAAGPPRPGRAAAPRDRDQDRDQHHDQGRGHDQHHDTEEAQAPARGLRAGLYGLKPWYAARLAGVRRLLVARGVRPGTISAAGVGFGCAAGAALAVLRPGPAAGCVVAALLAARLACANLDGAVARDAGRTTRFGTLVNEAGDRGAELGALAGCLALAPAWLVAATGLAATLPSWVALAGAAAGGPRLQGGPVGKTERCLLLVAVAAGGAGTVVLPVLAVGSAATAVIRTLRLRALFRAAPARMPA
jgi:CDP-diacylglycerol---glycerol-3-phosphate 3-phosphatidyltransferase